MLKKAFVIVIALCAFGSLGGVFLAGLNIYTREECRDCWARLYCSGGCAANAYHATGSVRGVYADGCDLFRKRMECAIAVAVARELGTE